MTALPDILRELVLWPAPWWFGRVIAALDATATFNLAVALWMFVLARSRARKNPENRFALRVIVGSGKVLAVSLAWFLNITIMLWVIRADPLKSNAIWWVRLLWSGGSIAGTTDLIAATLAQRWEIPWRSVFWPWWSGVLTLLLVLSLLAGSL